MASRDDLPTLVVGATYAEARRWMRGLSSKIYVPAVAGKTMVRGRKYGAVVRVDGWSRLRPCAQWWRDEVMPSLAGDEQ